MGRAIPRAVLKTVGSTPKALEVGRLLLIYEISRGTYYDDLHPLPEALEDTLVLLSAIPLATVEELSRIGRIPATTLRERLGSSPSKAWWIPFPTM